VCTGTRYTPSKSAGFELPLGPYAEVLLDRLAWSDMFEGFLSNKYTVGGCYDILPPRKSGIRLPYELHRPPMRDIDPL